MDFTNINDPAGVKALLDQLRESQAWQELSTVPTNADTNVSENNSINVSLPVDDDITIGEATPEESREDEEPIQVSHHISSLLSRLQTHNNEKNVTEPSSINVDAYSQSEKYHSYSPAPNTADSAPLENEPCGPGPKASLARVRSTRSLTFNQSLPVIGRLADDSKFLVKLDKIREDQSQLEKKLWEERCHIIKCQEDKVKVMQAKAAIIGTGISQDDAKALENSFARELQKFDSERALLAWDALIASQQSTLEGMGVPIMFVTSVKSDRERQQRIIQVLDGLGGPENDEDMEP